MRIHQLSAGVINQIAAGEVIERPASVVKELLENSVDALATSIEVDVQAGGTEQIRIVDDGEGIHPDDLMLAVTSHATSKIRGAEDLFRVSTLGFRGEAMASIAEVSRLRLRSRPPDLLAGTELEVVHGDAGEPTPCGCPPGTLIEVRQLFANTPVRRKYLRSVATEFSHISEQFTRVALGHPRLRMVLRHNGRTVFELPPAECLPDRLAAFYGAEHAEQLIPIESEAEGVRLWGYVAHPSLSKSTRKGQYLFLNGRWIQDRSLQHALGEGYRGLLMVGRHPVCYLFLEVPADYVDVNVHPTKSEVRFRDGHALYRQVLATIRTKFLGMDLPNRLRVPAETASTGLSGFQPAAKLAAVSAPSEPQTAVGREFADWAARELNRWQPPAPESRPTIGDSGADAESLPPSTSASFPAAVGEAGSIDEQGDSAAADPEAPGSIPTGHAASAPVGQFPDDGRAMQVHDCYLILETEQGLTVIDQHALHERILYEHFRRRVLDGAVESQGLLVPLPIELTKGAVELLLEQSAVLSQLGFAVEDFGNGTVMLSRYPAMLGKADLARVVRDMIEHLEQLGRAPDRRDLLDELLHMMSCKAAIKAGQRLAPEEIDSLVAQRHLVDDAHHCPHGRPTALVLSRAELDRQFGRLG